MNFNKDDIQKYHDDVDIYRNLYEGNHSQLFSRARHYIKTGEITDEIQHGAVTSKHIKTPYIVANISKLIVDIPALFVSRSIGKLMTNYPINEEEAEEGFHTNTEHLEKSNLQAEMTEESHTHVEGEPFDLQQDTLDQISDNSKLDQQHSMNIKQWQIDGGLVLVPEIINGQVKLSFKERNIYFELDDGKTHQLRYYRQIDEKEYLHVHEEIEQSDKLQVSHRVYDVTIDNKEDIEINEPELFEQISGVEYNNKDSEFIGRKRTFIEYLAYAPTFMNKYGTSALKGQEGKQDEVNWTITRNAQTFERNGKPRLSVTSEVWDRLEELSERRHGTPTMIDHRDLEITEMNEKGEAIKIHQIDVDKIGDITYVKDIIKIMLMETQTSEKAIDFFNETKSSTQSGIAKFYDLFLSVMKAEQLRNEYVNFIQRGIESCLWLLQRDNSHIVIEKPIIQQIEMLPVTSKEVTEENNTSYAMGTQSLEQTIRNNNPDKSEEWITNELETIEAGKVSTDSMTFLRGNMTGQNFNDNQPFEDEGESDE